MAWNIFKKNQQVAKDEPVKKIVQPTEEKVSLAPGKKFPVSETALFVRPIVTEKSLRSAGEHVYVFEVVPRATKVNIKKAFYNLYGVMPLGVRVMNMAGKEVRFGQRKGVRKDWKKALITIPKDKTVDIG
jgi:large subunit ribosomal protein L23